jgi:hypothetical protein
MLTSTATRVRRVVWEAVLMLMSRRIQDVEPGRAAERHHLLSRHLRRAALARVLHIEAPRGYMGVNTNHTGDNTGQERGGRGETCVGKLV